MSMKLGMKLGQVINGPGMIKSQTHLYRSLRDLWRAHALQERSFINGAQMKASHFSLEALEVLSSLLCQLLAVVSCL